MRDAAESKHLKDASIKHLAETKVHVERLDEVFRITGKQPEKTCDAIMGRRLDPGSVSRLARARRRTACSRTGCRTLRTARRGPGRCSWA
ncbi:DUF892 family protein [Ensifer adhaerens]|uniref:DUF892 family protein n=1 Tax=Ensifer adhaerens TaxID=106592 RepID=UPI003B8A69B6